jgi:hypothetical protein
MTERVSSVDVSNVLRREETTGNSSWAAGLVASADSAGNPDAARDGFRRTDGSTLYKAASYLRSAGIVVREPGWGRNPQAKPAIEVTSDPAADSKPVYR